MVVENERESWVARTIAYVESAQSDSMYRRPMVRNAWVSIVGIMSFTRSQ